MAYIFRNILLCNASVQKWHKQDRFSVKNRYRWQI